MYTYDMDKSPGRWTVESFSLMADELRLQCNQVSHSETALLMNTDTASALMMTGNLDYSEAIGSVKETLFDGMAVQYAGKSFGRNVFIDTRMPEWAWSFDTVKWLPVPPGNVPDGMLEYLYENVFKK